MMRKVHAVVPLVIVMLFSLAAAAQTNPLPPSAQTDRFLVGACTHFSQGKGVVELNLASLQRAGIRSIRDEVPWGAIEREKGKLVMPERFDTYVRRAADAGVNVLLILDYSNRHYDDGDRPRSPEAIEGFCKYAEFVVKHFGKHVRLYEIWNEWDIGIGLPQQYNKGGSAEDYAKLLKAVYPRIKAADPGVTVIAGACTSGAVRKGWLEDIVKLGALDSCDAISIHSYNYSDKFPERGPEACSAWMTGVQEMLRKYHDGKDVPFYVTEMGWPTHVTQARHGPGALGVVSGETVSAGPDVALVQGPVVVRLSGRRLEPAVQRGQLRPRAARPDAQARLPRPGAYLAVRLAGAVRGSPDHGRQQPLGPAIQDGPRGLLGPVVRGRSGPPGDPADGDPGQTADDPPGGARRLPDAMGLSRLGRQGRRTGLESYLNGRRASAGSSSETTSRASRSPRSFPGRDKPRRQSDIVPDAGCWCAVHTLHGTRGRYL